MHASVPNTILAHWYKLIENLETSSLEFYASVESALSKRAVPDATTSRVDWREGGVGSAKREYLRVSRGRYTFDICAAPFGSGFFVSSWLGEPRPSPILPTLITVLAFGSMWYAMRGNVGLIGGFVSALAIVLAVLFGIGILLSERGNEVYIIVIPIIGTIFQWLFRPLTYYRIDTALMFQSAVHLAVLEVIDGLTETKGLRPLSELERKPVMRDFYK